MAGRTFEQEISYITARIESYARDGKGTVGTGFIYSFPVKDRPGKVMKLLISNKHVFIDRKGEVRIKLNKRAEGEDEPSYGISAEVSYKDYEAFYFEHPDKDVDLACVNVSSLDKVNAFYMNLQDDFLEDLNYEHVAPGTGVLFVGYPNNIYDVQNNLPLIRNGTIASMPEIDFNGKGQIVIDAQVFPGSSGSPVFVLSDSRYLLLGVVSETIIRHSKLQTLPANHSNEGVEQILGLGIVIKQRHVRELIDYATEEFTEKLERIESSREKDTPP